MTERESKVRHILFEIALAGMSARSAHPNATGSILADEVADNHLEAVISALRTPGDDGACIACNDVGCAKCADRAAAPAEDDGATAAPSPVSDALAVIAVMTDAGLRARIPLGSAPDPITYALYEKRLEHRQRYGELVGTCYLDAAQMHALMTDAWEAVANRNIDADATPKAVEGAARAVVSEPLTSVTDGEVNERALRYGDRAEITGCLTGEHNGRVGEFREWCRKDDTYLIALDNDSCWTSTTRAVASTEVTGDTEALIAEARELCDPPGYGCFKCIPRGKCILHELADALAARSKPSVTSEDAQ